jgi:hypothetical protein
VDLRTRLSIGKKFKTQISKRKTITGYPVNALICTTKIEVVTGAYHRQHSRQCQPADGAANRFGWGVAPPIIALLSSARSVALPHEPFFSIDCRLARLRHRVIVSGG